MSKASLIWRIPTAALSFTLAWHLVRRIMEANEEGVEFEMLGPVFIGMPLFVLILLLGGIVALSPTSPKLGGAFFGALGKSVSKHWQHWID